MRSYERFEKIIEVKMAEATNSCKVGCREAPIEMIFLLEISYLIKASLINDIFSD